MAWRSFRRSSRDGRLEGDKVNSTRSVEVHFTAALAPERIEAVADLNPEIAPGPTHLVVEYASCRSDILQSVSGQRSIPNGSGPSPPPQSGSVFLQFGRR